MREMQNGRRGCSRRLRIQQLETRTLLAATTLVAEADTYTRAGVGAGNAAVLDALDVDGPGDRAVYVRFDVSGIDLDAAQSVTLNLFKTPGTRNDTIVTGRFDVYGLTSQRGNTLQDWDEATLADGGVGAEYANTGGDGLDTGRLFNLDQESGADVVESVQNVDGAAQSISGPDLVAFLASRQADDGLATFITYVDAGAFRGWGYGSRENADPALRPVLVIDDGQPETDPYPEEPVVLPRQVERLDRGVVATRTNSSTIYVGWRLLGDDPADVAFNLYRSTNGGEPVKLNGAPLSQTTDFVDTTASVGSTNAYSVRAVIDGVEHAASKPFEIGPFATIEQHLTLPLVIPPGGQTPTGEAYTYEANDASVGDLDGDGQYEVILKWNPTNAKDNAQAGYTGPVYVDAYTLAGDLLWRIDLGQNVRAGAHYTQMAVFDFDGDGRSEVIMRTAPGTIDGQGVPVLLPGDSVTDDYRNSNGYVLSGPEYLSVFDGLTGAALDTTPFEPQRGSASEWGDSYGNRVDRFTVGVAYLDGQRPSVVFGRGYYGPQSGLQARNEVAAYDFRDGQLVERWVFEASTIGPNQEYIGEGAHSLSIADVDGDGYDEIIYGASAIDHDGTGLYATGLGHGDALHVSDMDPANPGLEVFMVHESPGAYQSGGRDAGGELRDAQTGELLFQIPSNNDVGRGVALDIDPNHVGYEFWATTNEGTRMIYNVSGEALYPTPGNMMYNFGVWWDADLSRELLDGTTISEWNNPGRSNLVSPGSSGINSTSGLSGNNGTKNTPSLTADLFGDWREEVIWRRSDNSALEIWTSTIPSTTRLTTLMHDTMYRVAIAWQNGGYNQPPHPSFWVGEGMETPPQPLIYFGGELRGDYNQDGIVDGADYTVWRDTLGSQTNLAADGDHNGVVDQGDLEVWRQHYGDVAAQALVAGSATLSATQAVEQAATESAPIAFVSHQAASADEPVGGPFEETADALSVGPIDLLLLLSQESGSAEGEQHEIESPLDPLTDDRSAYDPEPFDEALATLTPVVWKVW